MIGEHRHSIPSTSIVVLITLIGVIGYIASRIYNGLFISYMGIILKIEEYSYLLVFTPLATWCIIDVLLKYFRPVGISIDRVLVFFSSYFASLIFYAIYKLNCDSIIQYGTFSFVLLALSLIALVYRPVNMKYYLAIIFLITFLVPLPLSWLNFVFDSLSRVTGYLVAFVSGGEYLAVDDRVLVYVIDSTGMERVFEVGYAWSGAACFTSVLAISPLIIYRVSRCNTTTLKKIKGLVLSVSVATATALLANFLILLSVLLVAKYCNYDVAISVFSWRPFLIYVFLAILSVIHVLNRVLGCTRIREKNYGKESIRIWEEGFTAQLAIGLIFMVLMSYGFIWFADNLGSEVIVGRSAFIQSMDAIFANPSIIVLNNTDTGNISSLSLPSPTAISSISSMNEIVIKYNDKFFPGYMEVVETPSRLYGWHVYMAFQGYRILKSWSIVDNTTINYMLLEKNKQIILLGYTVYRVPVPTDDSMSIAYVRVSLFFPVTMESCEEIMLTMKEIFESAPKYTGVTEHEDSFTLLEKIILVENTLILAGMALVVLILSKNYLPLLTKRLRSRRP